MTKAEIFEEIRALLREPQAGTVERPWNFTDADIVPQIRSALRHLRTRGLATTGVMDMRGEFTTVPATEREGALIALFVAEKLVSGDLIQKLHDGELGVVFRAGSDMIDTKEAAKSFQKVATTYREEFQILLTIGLTDADGGTATYGGQEALADGITE